VGAYHPLSAEDSSDGLISRTPLLNNKASNLCSQSLRLRIKQLPVELDILVLFDEYTPTWGL